MAALSAKVPQPLGCQSREQFLGSDELMSRVFQYFASNQRDLYGTLPLVCKRWNETVAELQTALEVQVKESNSTAISTALWVSRNGRRLKTFRMLQAKHQEASPYWNSILVALAIHARHLGPSLRLKELILRFQFDYDRGFDVLHFLAPACSELTTLEIDMIDSPYVAGDAVAPLLEILGSCPQLQELRLSHMDIDAVADLLGNYEDLKWPEWPSQLTALHISDVKREDITLTAAWPSLKGLTGLHSLTWETTFSPGTAIDALPGLPHLTYLAINELVSPDQLEALTSALTKLHELRHLVATHLVDYHMPSWDPRESYAVQFEGFLSGVATLTKLTHLSLNSNEQLGKCEQQVLSRLRPLQQLQHLGISRTKVSDVSALSALTALTCLEALRNGLDSDEVLGVLPWLQKCKVEGLHLPAGLAAGQHGVELIGSDVATSDDVTDSSDEEDLWGAEDGDGVIDLVGDSDDELGFGSDLGSDLVDMDSESEMISDDDSSEMSDDEDDEEEGAVVQQGAGGNGNGEDEQVELDG